MKSQSFVLQRYDADEGKVFDWKVPRFSKKKNENGEEVEVQTHLYKKTLFIGVNDSIDNYIEVDTPKE